MRTEVWEDAREVRKTPQKEEEEKMGESKEKKGLTGVDEFLGESVGLLRNLVELCVRPPRVVIYGVEVLESPGLQSHRHNEQ